MAVQLVVMQGKQILEISGTVLIKEGKATRRKSFKSVIVSGDTDAEIKKNFRYSRTFSEKKDRGKAQIMQSEGRVSLENYTILNKLGRTVPVAASKT